MKIIVLTALCLSCFASWSCAGALDDPDRFEDQFTRAPCDDLEHTLFQPTCATAGCHTAADTSGGLDLETDGLIDRLMDSRANGGAGYLIDKSNPVRSVLFTKVTSQPPFLFRMPFSETPLTTVQQQCILKYVETAAVAAKAAR